VQKLLHRRHQQVRNHIRNRQPRNNTSTKRDNVAVFASSFFYSQEIVIFFLPKEAVLLEFKRANGSGWLTNYRLILCDHEPGHLEGHTPVVYALKDFKKAQVNGSTLIVKFKGKKQAILVLPKDSPDLLQEIKEYLQNAAL
jgi:hypothetical protein